MKDLCNWKMLLLIPAFALGLWFGSRDKAEEAEYTSKPIYLSTESNDNTITPNIYLDAGEPVYLDKTADYEYKKEDKSLPTIKLFFKPDLIIDTDIGIPCELIIKALTDSTCDWLVGQEISGFIINGALNIDASVSEISKTRSRLINHTDTPKPVCPNCGETDNYSRLFKKSWVDAYFGEVAIDYYICDECDKIFTIKHKEYYTTEKIK